MPRRDPEPTDDENEEYTEDGDRPVTWADMQRWGLVPPETESDEAEDVEPEDGPSEEESEDRAPEDNDSEEDMDAGDADEAESADDAEE
jgi:hypothetical protein